MIRFWADSSFTERGQILLSTASALQVDPHGTITTYVLACARRQSLLGTSRPTTLAIQRSEWTEADGIHGDPPSQSQ